MNAKMLKNVAVYALILGLGLGLGSLGPRVKIWLTPAYAVGDYSDYFLDAKANVIVYGTATCPYCAKTREYLKQQGIAYKDYLLDGSPKAEADFKRLGGKSVPLILIGNRSIKGFNKTALDEALVKAGYPLKG